MLIDICNDITSYLIQKLSQWLKNPQEMSQSLQCWKMRLFDLFCNTVSKAFIWRERSSDEMT